jgi:hypothetical protein
LVANVGIRKVEGSRAHVIWHSAVVVVQFKSTRRAKWSLILSMICNDKPPDTRQSVRHKAPCAVG